MTVGQTRTFAQYPLHYINMTYAPAKFEAALSNGLGGNAFTRNIWLVKVTWSIVLNIMWPMYLQRLKLLWPMVKEMHYQENTLFDLDPMHLQERSWGHTKCCPLPSTSCDLCTGKISCCYILWLGRRCIYMKIHYFTLTLGKCQTKCCPVPLTYSDLNTSKFWYCLIQRLRRRCNYKKIHYLTLTLGHGHTKCCPEPSTSCD